MSRKDGDTLLEKKSLRAKRGMVFYFIKLEPKKKK